MTVVSPSVGDPATAAWAGSVAAAIASLPQGFLAETVSSSAVTLATLNTYYPGNGYAAVTLTSTRRIRAVVYATFASTTALARFFLRPAYNTGSTPGSPGSGTPLNSGLIATSITGTGGSYTENATIESTILLAAGNYCFYPYATRSLGGSASDTMNTHAVLLYDEGAV